MSDQALVQVSPSHLAPRQRTGLHRAAMVGDSEGVSALIQGGCALDLQDRDGNTALHEASWHGFSPCVKMLVKAGADVNIRNKAGNIALHLAAQNAHVQTARLLLLRGSNTDTKNNVGETCLHVAARYDNKEVVKVLIHSQCSLTDKNQRGDTALHIAAALNHKKTVQLLLEAGIDANLKNNAERTALDKARDNNHKELAVLLARAPQVHRFLRGRTMKKQKERQRSQSACRVEAEPDQVATVEQGSSSATEDDPSLEQMERTKGFKTYLLHQETGSPVSNGNHKTRRRDKKERIWVDKKVKHQNETRQNFFEDSEDVCVRFGKSYQLYTLYRDKDGTVKQSPANGCHCKPLFKKLESELKSTQEEISLQILNVQEQVSSKIGQMDRRNRQQIKVMDMLNQARVAAERRHLMNRLEQQAARGREEAQMTQAAVRGELKRWCMSQLQDRDLHRTSTNSPYSKLLHSPSVGQSSVDSDLESLPLLSVLSGGSSASLATYVNVVPLSWSSCSVGSEQDTANKKYFEMKVDRSPDDYQNTAQFPLSGSHEGLCSADPSWQPVEVQEVSVKGKGFGNSSSRSSSVSSTTVHGPRWIPPTGRTQGPRGQCQELVRVGHSMEDTSRAVEVYMDRPTEGTFTQERNNLHAVEVTQRFFETVSSQLELWYERKLQEVERQTELQAQKDKEELLQRINTLETELQRLQTNTSSDNSTQTPSDELQE